MRHSALPRHARAALALLAWTAGAAAPCAVRGDEPAPSAAWAIHVQSTYVLQRKPALRSPYQGPNSLLHRAETGYTLTATAYLGVRPWPGADLFVNAESIQSVEISGLHGLGGFPNGENQKSGGVLPTLYLARLFLRQTFALGGEPDEVAPDLNALGGRTTRRRLVVTAGRFAVIDVFDPNAYAHDPRTQFLNWALMAYGASDFAADTRGYSAGVAVEWHHDDWVVRAGRFAQPRVSNGLALDPDLFRRYGDSLELEHGHALGRYAGTVRLSGFRNVAQMGGFGEALRSAGAAPPSVVAVRRWRSKAGFGVGFDQALPAGLGLFGRFSWNDGRTETYAFAEIERSFTLGLAARGTAWRRPDDAAGIALVVNGLSGDHVRYLEASGLGVFLGDGRLRYAPERIVEAYYAFQAVPGVRLSADAQAIVHPGYNADRGPAAFLGARLHLER